MRSHVTEKIRVERELSKAFQYRKRYEVTCDLKSNTVSLIELAFQYRKRYEVTCDFMKNCNPVVLFVEFQYRKRYEVTCDGDDVS